MSKDWRFHTSKCTIVHIITFIVLSSLHNKLPIVVVLTSLIYYYKSYYSLNFYTRCLRRWAQPINNNKCIHAYLYKGYNPVTCTSKSCLSANLVKWMATLHLSLLQLRCKIGFRKSDRGQLHARSLSIYIYWQYKWREFYIFSIIVYIFLILKLFRT